MIEYGQSIHFSTAMVASFFIFHPGKRKYRFRDGTSSPSAPPPPDDDDGGEGSVLMFTSPVQLMVVVPAVDETVFICLFSALPLDGISNTTGKYDGLNFLSIMGTHIDRDLTG